MADNYESNNSGLESPAQHGFAVTPDDGTDLAIATRFIHVGVAGDMQVTLVGDTSPITIINLQVGWHPLRCKRIYATSTTCGSIVGFY